MGTQGRRCGRGVVVCLIGAVVCVAAGAAEETPEGQQAQIIELFSASPAVFIENTGQIEDSSVRYVFKGSGANIYHTTNGPVFQLFKREKDAAAGNSEDALMRPRHRHDDPSSLRYEGQGSGDFNTVSYSFSASFPGAKRVKPVGADLQKTKVSYYIGSDPGKWRTGVPTYGKVVYPNLYDGIDLHTLGRRSHLKYEFHVAPGAGYSQIVIRYEGIEGLSIDGEGKLHIQTPIGELVDDAPYIYQEIDGRRIEISGAYRLIDKTSHTFEITSEIDRDAELVIDPDLAWASFLGGSGTDYGYGIAVDSAGDALLTGETYSSNFPTPGGFDTSHNGYWDVFVAKVTNSGQLSWASFLGESGRDEGYTIGVDTAGELLLTGYTESSDFPTPGGFDTSHNGGRDAFVAKVAGDGSQLVWASFLGGSGHDWGHGIAVDSGGNALITGWTDSADFPTPGGFDTSQNGNPDVFVAKVTNSGQLSWSSFLGGSSYDFGRGIAVDPGGNALLTGYTYSSDFPVPGGFDTSRNGDYDGFVAKIDVAGLESGDLSRNAYVDFEDVAWLGGFWHQVCGSPDWCEGCDVDGNGAVDVNDFVAIARQWVQETL